jgi:hypothetical protein
MPPLRLPGGNPYCGIKRRSTYESRRSYAQVPRQQSSTTSFDGATPDAAVRQFQARQFQARQEQAHQAQAQAAATMTAPRVGIIGTQTHGNRLWKRINRRSTARLGFLHSTSHDIFCRDNKGSLLYRGWHESEWHDHNRVLLANNASSYPYRHG